MHRPCVTSGMDIKMSPKAERALPSHRNGKTHGPSHVHNDAEMRKDFILGDAKFLESCGLRAFAPLDTEAPFARFKLAIFSEALIKTVSLCYMSRLFNQMHCDTTVTIRRLSLELCLFFFSPIPPANPVSSSRAKVGHSHNSWDFWSATTISVRVSCTNRTLALSKSYLMIKCLWNRTWAFPSTRFRKRTMMSRACHEN